MLKITVIGGSGFLGTKLCQILSSKEIDFEIIDLKYSPQFPEKTKLGDVRNLDGLRATVTGDLIILLAAVHRDDVKDKSEYFRTNVVGAKNVAALCMERSIRKIIFTSSVAVYGFAEPGTGEDGPIKPFNEYGRTKYLAEKELRRWQCHDIANQLIIIRPAVIFGEGNRGNVFNLLNQIARKKFIMVGNGKNKKSMAYVDNVAAFIEASIKTDSSLKVFNYLDTPDMDMNTLVSHVRWVLVGKRNVGLRIPYWLGLMLGLFADALARITRKQFPVSSIRVRKFCSWSAFSSAKSQLNGFTQPFSLSEGLERTLRSEFISPDPNQNIFYSE